MTPCFCEVCGTEIISDDTLWSLPERLVVYTERVTENSDADSTRIHHNSLIVCTGCRSVLLAMFDVQIDSLKSGVANSDGC
jgi:hypothetical protein